MHADLKGALAQLDKSYRWFEHKGNKMSKSDVKKVLEYGIKNGYETTAQLSDEEIDLIIKQNKNETAIKTPTLNLF